MKEWLTMFQKPAKKEVVLVAVYPDIIGLVCWDGEKFVNACGDLKYQAEDISYWMPIPSPWREENHE